MHSCLPLLIDWEAFFERHFLFSAVVFTIVVADIIMS